MVNRQRRRSGPDPRRVSLRRSPRRPPLLQGQPPAGPLAPVPPALPPGRVLDVPGRGEMFLREAPGPPDGPVILLLHGWTASADLNWFPLYEPLTKVGRVLAVDHRGHGRGIRSEEEFTLEAAADDAAALVQHLGHERVVAIGYSMGSPIAMLLWRRHPGLVSGLIFEATALEWQASLRERLTWKLLAGAELVFRLGPSKGLVERYLSQVVELSPELAQWQGWLKGEMRRGDPSALAQAGRALSRYDARPFAGSVGVPAAVVVTTLDRLVRPKKQRALASAIPSAKSFELAADHDAPLLHPLDLATATTDALAWVLDRLGEDRASAASASESTAVTELADAGRGSASAPQGPGR